MYISISIRIYIPPIKADGMAQVSIQRLGSLEDAQGASGRGGGRFLVRGGFKFPLKVANSWGRGGSAICGRNHPNTDPLGELKMPWGIENVPPPRLRANFLQKKPDKGATLWSFANFGCRCIVLLVFIG